MMIVIQNGEAVTVKVPAGLQTSARVAIQTEYMPIATVTVEDGLIGAVQEHVCRRDGAAPVEDRMKLWAHLVSQHAGIFSPEMTLKELIEMHEHEHDGPGTVRDHPRESREYSLKKLGKVLSESDR